MLTAFTLANLVSLAAGWNDPIDQQIGKLQAENVIVREEFEVTGWAIFEHGNTIDGDISVSRVVGKDDTVFELLFPANTDLNKLARKKLRVVLSGRVLGTKGVFDRPQIEVTSFSVPK
jgi:hypothetical protein